MPSNSTPLKLPLVNLTSLHLGSDAWAEVREQVRHALETYGCFEVVYSDVTPEARRASLEAVKQLFALPIETKLRNTASVTSYAYAGLIPQLPLYESLGIQDAVMPEAVKQFTDLMWPQGNAIFCESLCAFAKKLSELDILIRKMVLESYGVEKYFDSHLESTNYVLRATRYKSVDTEEAVIGLAPHSDATIVTVLCQLNHVDGFEIQTKDGQWFNISPSSPDSLTVMAGDSFMAWTNGRTYSPSHRVMMRRKEARYSVGLFSLPKAGVMVEAPAELVDEEHPLLFKPFDVAEYLRYQREIGKSPTLKDYCGA